MALGGGIEPPQYISRAYTATMSSNIFILSYNNPVIIFSTFNPLRLFKFVFTSSRKHFQ